jgi:hypothetical protein
VARVIGETDPAADDDEVAVAAQGAAAETRATACDGHSTPDPV